MINGATDKLPLQEEHRFELNGVELYGSFTVKFSPSGLWSIEHFEYKETKVSGKDLQKLAKASKSKISVPIKFGNGEGKARIGSFHYDPGRQMLISISISLVEWNP